MNGVARMLIALATIDDRERAREIEQRAYRIVRDAIAIVYADERGHAEWIDIGGES